jgi:hypothetical protein
MTNPWQDDPTVVRWAQHVIDDMVPKMKSSAVCISLVPNGDLAEKSDVQYWVELGAMICMDKPIMVVVMGDAELPPKLQAVADRVVRLPQGVSLSESETLAAEIAEFAKEQP